MNTGGIVGYDPAGVVNKMEDELTKDWIKFFNSLKDGEIKALKVFLAYRRIHAGVHP
jgi:hypothetical protein